MEWGWGIGGSGDSADRPDSAAGDHHRDDTFPKMLMELVAACEGDDDTCHSGR